MAETVTREYHVLEVFGASGRVTSCWQKNGYRGFSFDIKHSPEHDITSECGMKCLLTQALKLLGLYTETGQTCGGYL